MDFDTEDTEDHRGNATEESNVTAGRSSWIMASASRKNVTPDSNDPHDFL